MEHLQYTRLSGQMKDEVAALYARVFAGPPWFEIKKCALCNETYGKGEDLSTFHNGDGCRRCGHPLQLIDYWLGGPALRVFEDAVAQNGFVGVAARTGDTGELVGFSWGFSVPSVDSPSVLFSQVSLLFREQGIEASTTFYAAETGLLPDFQQRGEGKRLMLARFREAREAGFLGMCGRTINPKIVKIYEDCFGEENVRVVFHDPDPVKADRKWYYAPLSALRSKTD